MARKEQILVALGFLIAAVAASATEPTTPSNTALAWLKGLSGTWRGKAEWSGGRTGSNEMTAVYAVSGNGTAVVENLEVGGVTLMTSVYHEDGSDLRMTHYCAAGNQPRLKATGIDPAKKIVRFKMVDITGRQGPGTGHVDEVELRFPDDDHVTILFTFVGGKVPSVERVDLMRNGK